MGRELKWASTKTRGFLGAVVAFMVAIGLELSATPVAAQLDPAKSLPGKWRGEIMGHYSGNRVRVLVINAVHETTADGRFGVSEDRLGRIQISVRRSGDGVTVEFATTAREVIVPWKLTLVSEKVLTGTVHQPVRGPAGRIEFPVKFEKVE
jgi:hypothetical protein